MTLSSTTSATPSFAAPTGPTSLTFSLVVNDGAANSPASTVIITVSAPGNVAPVANTGANQSVNEGAAVTLNGSASSDPDNGPSPLTYAWTQTAGPAVTLTGATTAAPTFTAPTVNWPAASSTLTFQLTVSDGAATNAASVNVVVNNVNATPIADAGANQSVNEAAAVTLNASASSDPDNGPSPLTYSWTQTAGPAVTLSGTLTAAPTFTAPTVNWPTTSTTLTFRVTVSDSAATNAASVNVVVNNVNVAPVANAGPDQTVASATPTVTLNGSASSDPDSGPSPLTYKWTQTAGPAVTLSSTTVAGPTFTAPAGPTSLTFSLVVNDGAANSPASTVVITVNAPGNVAPIANAGADQSVNEGAAVTLNGSASTDPDGGPSPLTYSWTQTAGPAVTLTGATTAAPTFTAPTINWPTTATTLTFQLTVSDGAATNAASVNVVVNNVNATPIANAGAAQTIASGANASLNATASSDPDNGPSPLTYKWTQTAGPAVTLSSTTSATPSFTAPTGPTSLTFSLVVNDGAANSPASTVIITVSAPATWRPSPTRGPTSR